MRAAGGLAVSGASSSVVHEPRFTGNGRFVALGIDRCAGIRFDSVGRHRQQMNPGRWGGQGFIGAPAVPARLAAKHLGDTIQSVMQFYAHALEGDEQNAADRFGALVGGRK